EREGKMFREDLGDGESLEMAEIPNGNFYMGSSPTDVSNIVKELQRVGLPLHQAQQVAQSETPHGEVKVVSFFIARTEITQGQWARVASWPKVKIGLNPEPSFFPGKDRPVEQVRWD